jgi:hypothetical protein
LGVEDIDLPRARHDLRILLAHATLEARIHRFELGALSRGRMRCAKSRRRAPRRRKLSVIETATLEKPFGETRRSTDRGHDPES